MSFYTALTGLNGSQADIAATSNNIANVGTTGFKRSRAEFGDIFATSPLQNSSSSIGSGSILKGVKQQFTQGNIAASLNALDLAISGQGFFALKPSLTSSQVVYTRNGSFNVDNNRNVVDSTGQFLLTYPVNEDGSVTSKTINDAVPLQLPVTSGEPKATSNIDLSINLPADAAVITDNPKFADGYQFSTSDPESFTNSTSLTIFDDLGNPTIATVYFIKTQAATADDPTNKYDTRLVIDETVINPDLVASVNDNGEQLYIDRFGRETTVANIPDDNYFSEGKGSPLYRKDNLNETIPSQPAKLTGSQSSFDFGEEGNKLIEITNDPMRFNATREADNPNSSTFWGKDFLLVNVDDGDVPVSIDLRPGFYNATQLAEEVERSINDAYGDDNKLQIRSNVDDVLNIDFFTLSTADGTLNPLSDGPIEVDLLQSSYVSEQLKIDTSGSSPDFTREEFLAHSQVRLNDVLDAQAPSDLGVSDQLFTRTSGSQMSSIYEETDVVSFNYTYLDENSDTTTEERHLVYGYYNKSPSLSVFDNKTSVKSGGSISYDAPNNVLTIQLDSAIEDIEELYSVGEAVTLAGSFDTNNNLLNGRSLTILGVNTSTNEITINTTGEGFSDSSFRMDQKATTSGLNFSEAYVLSDVSSDVEAFFEGADLQPQGAVNSYNNKKIVLRETADSKHSHGHNDAQLSSMRASTITDVDKEYYAETNILDEGGETLIESGTTFYLSDPDIDVSTGDIVGGSVVAVMDEADSDNNTLIDGKTYQNVSGGSVTLTLGGEEVSVAEGESFTYAASADASTGIFTDATATHNPESASSAAAQTTYFVTTAVEETAHASGSIFTADNDLNNYPEGRNVAAPLLSESADLDDGSIYLNVGDEDVDHGGVGIGSGKYFVFDATNDDISDAKLVEVEFLPATTPLTSTSDLTVGNIYRAVEDIVYASGTQITADPTGSETQIVVNTTDADIHYYDAASDAPSSYSAGDMVVNETDATLYVRSEGTADDNSDEYVAFAPGVPTEWSADYEVAKTYLNASGVENLDDNGDSVPVDFVSAGIIPAGGSVTLTADDTAFANLSDSEIAGLMQASIIDADAEFRYSGPNSHLQLSDDATVLGHASFNFLNLVNTEDLATDTAYYAAIDVPKIAQTENTFFTTTSNPDFSAGNVVATVTAGDLIAGQVYTYYVDAESSSNTASITLDGDNNISLSNGAIFKYDPAVHNEIDENAVFVPTTPTSTISVADFGGDDDIKLIALKQSFDDFSSESLGGSSSLNSLGLSSDSITSKTSWVDEKNPPIKVSYDAVNQRFQFGVNHTAIGPGTDSNFRAFQVYGASDATGTNNLGIPASDASPQTTISSTAVISGESFVADGGEMQINAKRFGAEVRYNSDTKTFVFMSGTTGETISADGALGVDSKQQASNIQVGRYTLDQKTGEPVNTSFDTATRYMGTGDNGLMGVGSSKNDTIFETARGLASEPARAIGASATEPLNEIFNLSSAGGANIFNVSVNGISGIIQVPSGNYVGSTLAAELQTRINQISDAETGDVVGGVTVQYQADTNNFVFTTGTTGDQSTIKVKGAAKLGLDDVPLGVGSVPTIVNLVQATNDAGVPLYVNAAGEIVETPPDNLVTDYYPLYIDEGELTFDKTGQIISPLNRVHYEQQAAGFSISLDVDYSASTQLSQPFSVNNLEQDGFTSGRLDGLDIDATGLLRANYTNGENRPLGKIVLANFNNQNGLKQVGNATFVETATSGTPTFGEAGAEGFGAIQSGSLERSNVDITEELVNLITAQRNFQASSKAIETSTQLTQAIINIRS